MIGSLYIVLANRFTTDFMSRHLHTLMNNIGLLYHAAYRNRN